MQNSRVAYQSRSPVFRTLSRSSSGYFSFDSEPSSPLITHSTATQTPSPSSQVITHALQRISEARGDAQNDGKDPLTLFLPPLPSPLPSVFCYSAGIACWYYSLRCDACYASSHPYLIHNDLCVVSPRCMCLSNLHTALKKKSMHEKLLETCPGCGLAKCAWQSWT